MRGVLCVLALAASVYCNNVMEHLPHFKVSELSEDFQKYEGLPDSCSQLSKDCVKKTHSQARHCIGMFYAEKRAEIAECKNEDAELAEASQAWQEASFEWHKNLDDCLQGKDAPAAASDAVYFLFKRQAHDCSQVPDLGKTDGFENGKACWAAFMGNKRFCNHCVTEDDGCKAYVACTGRGSADGLSDQQKAWHSLQKDLGKTKQDKKKRAKRMLMRCLGMNAERLRRF